MGQATPDVCGKKYLSFTIAFYYQEPHGGIEPSEKEQKALSDAKEIVRTVLEEAGIEHLPCYSWPDGSLYKYILSDKSLKEIRAQLDTLFGNNEIVRVSDVDETVFNKYSKVPEEWANRLKQFRFMVIPNEEIKITTDVSEVIYE